MLAGARPLDLEQEEKIQLVSLHLLYFCLSLKHVQPHGADQTKNPILVYVGSEQILWPTRVSFQMN